VHGTSDVGIGLVLYICRRIVEAHDGRIWVQPRREGGSVFSATIPIVAQPGTATEPRPAQMLSEALEAQADA
jgi:signal transduction histidine kinase